MTRVVKSKMKLLKQREIQEDNRTFDEILNDLKESVEVMACEWVELLCVAAKRESPLISAVSIRAKVIEAVGKPNGKVPLWKESTIRDNWPDWLKNPNMVNARNEVIAKKKLSVSNEQISKHDQERDEENEPISSMPMYEYEETHPKTETSPFQVKGEINRAIHTLFGRLTGINHMPHMEDDVKKQYVIETRERAKDIINGISKIERDFLYNWLTWLGMIMDDWTNLLEKADKTAYDTRE